MKPAEILHRGSLMTYQSKDTECCLGYLLVSEEHGVFEPSFGKLEVSSEEAQAHNRLLSQAEIQGLDQNCAVGMCGRFYTGKRWGQLTVSTWIGDIVSNRAQIKGSTITFERNAM